MTAVRRSEGLVIRAKVVALGVNLSVLSTIPVTISAHHSFASEFDAAKSMTLKGTVTKVERTNPHGWIYLDVKPPDGKVEQWAIETGSPAALTKQGIRRDSVPLGLEVIIKCYRAKNGSRTANGDSIALPDGRTLSLGSSLGNNQSSDYE
jgi:hypothetical protein